MQLSKQLLCRASRRSASRPRMGGPDGRHRHLEHSRKNLGGCVSERDLSSLDVADHGRTDSSGLPELRLRQAAPNPEITQISVVVGDHDKIAHGDTQCGYNPREYVDLRRRRASFPLVERGTADVGKARKISLRHSTLLSDCTESLSGETAHHATAHNDPTQTPMSRHAASDLSPMHQHVALSCWYSTYIEPKPVTPVDDRLRFLVTR